MNGLRYTMRGEFICNDVHPLGCDLAYADTWLFEPDRMLLSTVVHGRPLQVDLTALIEGDIELSRPIRSLICCQMGATGSVENLSLTLINSNEVQDPEPSEMNWDLGISMSSMDFRWIGRSIILLVSSLLDEHDATLVSLLGADQQVDVETELPIPKIDDFDMRLENILKDILTS